MSNLRSNVVTLASCLVDGKAYFFSYLKNCNHANTLSYSIIFQTGREIVVVAAVKSNDQAVSAVPLIVNAVLESHSFLVDTVAIIHSNQLPRTRFGEKQRKKAMTAFLEKKL